MQNYGFIYERLADVGVSISYEDTDGNIDFMDFDTTAEAREAFVNLIDQGFIPSFGR